MEQTRKLASEESAGKNEADGRTVTFDHQVGKIFANIQIGADVASSKTLLSNEGLAHMGVKLHGMGFVLTAAEANAMLEGAKSDLSRYIRPFFNGRDLVQMPRGVYVIDLFGLSEAEAMSRIPSAFQHLMDSVKPDRDAKAGNSKDALQYAKEWWLFGKPRPELRRAIGSQSKIIATTRTAKHRIFQTINSSVLTESEVVNFCLEDISALTVESVRSSVYE